MKNTKYLLLIILLVLSIISLRGITKMLYPSHSYIPVIDAPKDTTLAFIVDGELSETPPSNNNYKLVYVLCNDPDATGTITWNGFSWDISISGISSGSAKCDVYFENVPRGWKNAPEGSLLNGIKESQSAGTPTYTIPGREISTTDEGLRPTEDDYGVSYYYRGTVENNYLVFANMCWRIVRIDGLGNTKITLYNYNPTSASNPCDASLDGDKMAFARLTAGDSESYNIAFNTNKNSNTYIGYMYSNNPNSTDYNVAHANDNDSTILSNLKNWYDMVFNQNDKDKLADVIWCNDKRVINDTTYNPLSLSNVTGTGIGTSISYYQSTIRLYSTDNATPSLKCGTNKKDNLISKFTGSTATDGGYGNGKLNGYKIGLLTADEMVFAGETRPGTASTYYLLKNASNGSSVFSQLYWTLTPVNYKDYTYVWTELGGRLMAVAVDGKKTAVRPTVSLKSNTTISGGDGTQTNPFVVN